MARRTSEDWQWNQGDRDSERERRHVPRSETPDDVRERLLLAAGSAFVYDPRTENES